MLTDTELLDVCRKALPGLEWCLSLPDGNGVGGYGPKTAFGYRPKTALPYVQVFIYSGPWYAMRSYVGAEQHTGDSLPAALAHLRTELTKLRDEINVALGDGHA